MVAGSLVLLFGLAALAVDTSGFYQTARVGQTTADLACLAGVVELPAEGDAIDVAVEYTKANWPQISSASLTTSGSDSAILSDGDGNVVTYETGYGGDDDAMHVTVTERDEATFGRVLGVESVDIGQEAACARQVKMGGPGALPMAALPGTFNGNLHDCAAKVTGNCGALDVGSGANAWRDAISNGWDQQLEKHHGDETDTDPDTGHAVVNCPTSGACSANLTETGKMQGPFTQGSNNRLSVDGFNCTLPGPFNCDSISDVFGTAPIQLEDHATVQPAWWEPSVYGTYAAAKAKTNHYYFSGDIAHCDSPRLGTVPIVARDLDWDLGDPPGTWPNGKKDMKVIGFYLVYIREPDTPAELGVGPILTDIVHIAEGSTCDGEPFSLYSTGIPIESVKLIEP